MNEFICEPALMAEFIQKLNDATRLHRIFWRKNDFGAYYISRCTKIEPLNNFSFVFTFDEERDTLDAVVIYIKDLHVKYTPLDVEVWKHLKVLEWQIQECMRSIEATLRSMMEALSKM